MRGPQIFLWIVPVVLTVLAPFWWPQAADFLRPPDASSTSGSQSALSGKVLAMTGMSFRQYEKGREKWIVQAKEASAVEGEQSHLHMRSVAASFFGGNDREITITCDEAEYDADTDSLSLFPRVVVNTADGYEIRTLMLKYLAKNDTIVSESKVQMDGNGIFIDGQGLYYDLEKGGLRIKGPLTFERK